MARKKYDEDYFEDEDLYDEEEREEQLEDDELSPDEEGFMKGYDEADEIEAEEDADDFE